MNISITGFLCGCKWVNVSALIMVENTFMQEERVTRSKSEGEKLSQPKRKSKKNPAMGIHS